MCKGYLYSRICTSSDPINLAFFMFTDSPDLDLKHFLAICCYCPVALGVLSLKHRYLHDVQVYTWLMIRTYASVSSELCSRKKPVVVLPSLPALLSKKFHHILSLKCLFTSYAKGETLQFLKPCFHEKIKFEKILSKRSKAGKFKHAHKIKV